MEKLFDSEISAEKAKEKGNDTEGNLKIFIFIRYNMQN